jgi:hypothetical protein
MTHKFGHTSDKVLSKQNMGPLMIPDKERHRIYDRAIKQQMYPLGETYRDSNGLFADWAPFDFILSTMGRIPEGTTMMKVLKLFWAENWKYLTRVIKSYEAVSEDYIKAMTEMDDIVRGQASMSLELKACQEWVKTLDPMMQAQFMDFHMALKEKHEKEVAKIIEQERVRRDREQEEIAKKRKSED